MPPDSQRSLVGHSTRALVPTDGAGCFDLHVAPGIVIELAREPDGWMFWGINYDGVQFGRRAPMPSVMAEVLDAMVAGQVREHRADA